MTQTVIIECSIGKKSRNHRDYSSAMKGKTQKFSKGYSSGFVPDYRHAIETVGETEGFGSSCGADSEDSCTPKRKCISLNVDQSNTFNVPVQIISATKMSDTERKDLEMRLIGELQKVRMLQKKILSKIPAVTADVAHSTSTDGHAKKQGMLQRNSGRFEPTKQIPPPPPPHGKQLTVLLKQCENLIRNLMLHKYSWVFNTPVDVVKLKIPDYFNIIKHPMDLGTVKKKLTSGSYSSPLAFASDVRLTFTNAMTYNPPTNDVYIMADVLKKIFEKRWKPIGEKLAAAEAAVKREEEAAKRVKEAIKTEPLSLPQKRKTPQMEHVVSMPKNVKSMMSLDEKHELGNWLQSLSDDLPDHIIDFLRQQNHNANSNEDDDEIEIDIVSFNDDTLFELRKLLVDYFGSKQLVPHAKVEPCEMEILVESGVSNSSIHPCRVNEPADEDVDIGGDDPPVTICPPVEIAKDTAPKSSKCSSSSSSSSDSGSSSSDSDTASSSGSESDVKAASPTKAVMESGQPGVARDLEKFDATAPLDANRTIYGMNQQEGTNQQECSAPIGSVRLNQQEHCAHTEHVSVEAEDSREGENATSERQVSPDKLYRAALLRNRFADTILKAREKTLNQGEKKDPEKLRREREELERQQREEKARLKAEAKAAEEARKQAEAEAAAEAAAEAKRRREHEREAARQALLQMEKTVEINENSLFLKDLEILGAAHGEHTPSRAHEMSPDNLRGLGGFNLGGSNPLEQLGLFRKEEEEDDDDECGPTNHPEYNIEEGEID